MSEVVNGLNEENETIAENNDGFEQQQHEEEEGQGDNEDQYQENEQQQQQGNGFATQSSHAQEGEQAGDEENGEDNQDYYYSVFVGDLNNDVTENDLKEAFAECGPIANVLVFRDKVTNQPRGFGFCNFKTKEGRDKALAEPFVHKEIKGRACRVRREQKTTLFIGSLPKSLTTDEIRQELSNVLGGIPFELEMKFGPPPTSEPRGFGFATFPSYHVAEKARKALSVSMIRDRNLTVSWAEPMEEPDDQIMSSVKTIYINNIPISVLDPAVQALCAQYGPIVHCTVVKNPQTHESKGFAFVEFTSREDCLKALEALNGFNLEGQNLKVVLAKPQTENYKKVTHHVGVTVPGGMASGLCFHCGGAGHLARECPNPSPNNYHNQQQRGRGGRGRGPPGNSPGPARKIVRAGMNNIGGGHQYQSNPGFNPMGGGARGGRGGMRGGRGGVRGGRGGSNDNYGNASGGYNKGGQNNYYNSYNDPTGGYAGAYDYSQAYTGYQQGYGQQQQGYGQQYPQGYQASYSQTYPTAQQQQQQYYSGNLMTSASQYNGPTSDYSSYPQDQTQQYNYQQGGSGTGVRYNPY